MKDRYLFRGKRTSFNAWAYGYYALEDGRHGILYDPKDGVRRLLWVDVDPDTVGQCTGLRDKHDTLIFEGDVVRVKSSKPHPDDGTIGGVLFGAYRRRGESKDFPSGELGFYIQWFGEKNTFLGQDIIYWQGNQYIEVIGNIQDNPDLWTTEESSTVDSHATGKG